MTEESAFTKRKTFLCPHCGEMAVLPVQITLQAPVKPSEIGASVSWETLITSEQKQILGDAERSGLLTAVEEAIRRCAPESQPKDIRKYFLQTLLPKARPVRVPSFVLRDCIDTFGGNIDMWQAELVVFVVSDGTIKRVLPRYVVSGSPIKGNTKATMGRTDVTDEWALWRKTRHGYVAGTGAYWSTMRNRSIGEFARPVISTGNDY